MNTARDGAVRHATVRWLTKPPNGPARLRVDSGAFAALPLSIPGGEAKPRETTPGGLLTAAYSAFVATSLAQGLERYGVPAQELVVDVRCRLSPDLASRSVEDLTSRFGPACRASTTRGFVPPRTRLWELSRESLGICGDLHPNLRVSLVPASPG